MADIFNLADTWNDGAIAFTSIKMNVTDTASAAGSSLMDLQVGGSSRAAFDKNGVLTVNTPNIADSDTLFDFQENGVSKFKGTVRDGFNFSMGGSRYVTFSRDTLPVVRVGDFAGNGAVSLASTGKLSWNANLPFSGNDDLFVARDAANTLAQRNSTNSQAFNIYNTHTDANNYERARMGWNANAYEIKPEAAGTGTVRVLHISGLPTSNPGAGILWNDAGTVKVGV